MNDLELDLEGITEENYPGIVREITNINSRNIDDELERQASLYSWYYGLLASCKSKVRKSEADLEIFESLTRNDEYNRRTEEGQKITEKIMEAYVKSRPEYRELLETKMNLEVKYDLLRGVVTSLSHKKDTLIQMSSNARAEKNIYNS
jgi:hypothetical protein